MVGNKYYWLKLHNNFFEKEEIKMLLAMPNGTMYVIIYLKLLLKSLETEGTLIFKRTIPYTPEMIASITGENIDVVRIAIDIFINFRLMDSLENGALFMNEIENMVGSESKWAEIKRKQRNDKKKIMKKEEVPEIYESDEVKLIENYEQQDDKDTSKDNVQKVSVKSLIEKDKESDIELKKKIKKIYMDLSFIDDIIENVKITQNEYEKLVVKHGKANVNNIILKLDNYIANNRKKYKDHYRVINSWCINNTKYNAKYKNPNMNEMQNINSSHNIFQFD
jgi:predicted phage replisome organizer